MTLAESARLLDEIDETVRLGVHLLVKHALISWAGTSMPMPGRHYLADWADSIAQAGDLGFA